MYESPLQRKHLQSLSPRVPNAKFQDMSIAADDAALEEDWCWDDPWAKPGDVVKARLDMHQPCASRVLMGDLNSVLVADEAMRNWMSACNVMVPSTMLVPGGPIPLNHGRVLADGYIADIGILALVSLERQLTTVGDFERVARVDTAWADAGLPSSEQTTVRGIWDGRLWGGFSEGKLGGLGVRRSRRVTLSSITLVSACVGAGSKDYQRILSSWGFC